MRRMSSLSLLVTVSALFACEDGLDTPAFRVYSVSAVVAEVEGVLPLVTTSTSLQVKLLLTRAAFSGPFSSPAYVSSRTVPNCLATTFTSTVPPGGNAIDAGDLSFVGLRPTVPGAPTAPVTLVDINSARQPVSELTTPIVCQQIDDPFYDPILAVEQQTDIRHVCSVPTVGLIREPGATVFGAGTEVTITASGGSQSGAFSVGGLAPPPTLQPAGGFNLSAIDPREPVVAEWPVPDPRFTDPDAPEPLALIELLAVRADGTEGTQILCLEFISEGRKEIDQEALDLVPLPDRDHPATPTLITASLAAVNFATADFNWGRYLVGVGRGSVGQSLILP